MERLWEYLDEELPRAEAECMRHHLAECPTCGPHAAFEQRLLDRIAGVRPDHGDTIAVRRRVTATLAFQTLLPDWKDG
jgi:hypothetical protein